MISVSKWRFLDIYYVRKTSITQKNIFAGPFISASRSGLGPRAVLRVRRDHVEKNDCNFFLFFFFFHRSRKIITKSLLYTL